VRFQRMAGREGDLRTHTCAHCQTTFRTGWEQQKYCQPLCQSRARSARDAIRREARKRNGAPPVDRSVPQPQKDACPKCLSGRLRFGTDGVGQAIEWCGACDYSGSVRPVGVRRYPQAQNRLNRLAAAYPELGLPAGAET